MSGTTHDVSRPNWPRTRAGWVFTVLILSALILTGLEWFTDVKTTVIYDWRWYSAFAATLIVLLTSLYMALRREPERLEIGGSWPNQAWHMICGAIGFTALTGFAVFSGVPILLHFAGNAPGEMTVTVERKEVARAKGKCSPRILVKEFTFFGDEHLCVSDKAYVEVHVGSKIRLRGNISPFGIEPREYSWETREGAN